MFRIFMVLIVVSLALSVKGDVTMPAVFADHMVLQRGMKVPVWGWAEPGEKITVTFAGKKFKTKADADGNWHVNLKKYSAIKDPQVLTVEGNNSLIFSDVLVGDVWLCSGQSNMAMTVSSCNNPEAEAAAGYYPMIRHFKVGNVVKSEATEYITGSWQVASNNSILGWTAVGYFFGRDLHNHLDVPIGLINSSWGGTRVEAWISRDVISQLPGTENDIKGLDSFKDDFDGLKKSYSSAIVGYNKSYADFVALETDEEHLQKYSNPELDDSQWKEIKTPANWEAEGHPGVDGEVWYRRTIEIPASWAGKNLALDLGPIDEIDTTYYNGVKVGGMGTLKPLDTRFWNVPRHYTVPAELVKEGKAVIAMRIFDQSGQGGPWGGKADDMFIVPSDSKDDVDARISMSGNWKYDITCELPSKPRNPISPNIATVLYNGMINGLIPYGIKGAIWYQGESNSGNAYVYRERFPAMINDWRDRWNQGDFPFLWVQLANFQAPPEEPQDASWAVVRESQNETLSLPNTGTAFAIDIGAARDIHPKNKQDLGKRMALAARSVAYGEELVFSGPTYKSMKVEDNTIRIKFDNIGGGLEAKDGELKQFAIAGEDQKFVWADAVIDGDTVVVKAEEVDAPVAVRYAWATNPEGCNLYNEEGLPASPFRTDTWKVLTQK